MQERSVIYSGQAAPNVTVNVYGDGSAGIIIDGTSTPVTQQTLGLLSDVASIAMGKAVGVRPIVTWTDEDGELKSVTINQTHNWVHSEVVFTRICDDTTMLFISDDDNDEAEVAMTRAGLQAVIDAAVKMRNSMSTVVGGY